MGCGNEVTNEDFRKIEEARQGKHSKLDENALTPKEWEEFNKKMEEIEQKKEKIQEQKQKIEGIKDAKPINNVIMQYEGENVNEEKANELVEKIKNSSPDDALLFLRNENPSPFFVPGFNDIGDKVNLPEEKNLPEIKVYSPIQPTFENLGNLLDKRNPYNPWDEKITWHHYEQKGEPIMIIEERFHKTEHRILHGREPLNDREEWDNKQKRDFMQEATKQYLGKFYAFKEVRDALKEKSREAWSIRKDKK